ncbi:hypothetical protein PybrP1_000637 [[Pythium] brassicae (nom. inval.)]|nr:hypothetical protein PybrP1_000637 [[Pythium] brassicae (nom. inval.)]
MLRRGLSAAAALRQRRLLSTAASSAAQPRFARDGAVAASAALRVGDELHGFTLKRASPVPEYNVSALELEHAATGARYLHVEAADPTNVFAAMFRTPPRSSNGVAHILEHTVLCGSERFPVRDPFFNMLKRSLNTYMNALTASDHTMYPFATANEADWRNLLAVYLDAVFFPTLHELDFLQEGHRLEIADSSGESELVYKGVVYNEMKGVLSDSDSLFGTRLQQALLAGTAYGHVSGGDPAHIPALSYAELRAFHARHYHPSNCCFYSYGDLPLADHLAYLNEHVLARFAFSAESAATRVDSAPFDIFKPTGDAASSSPVPLQVVRGPASNMGASPGDADPNTKFCMAKFVDVDATDPFATFVMRVVGYLLTNGPSSPLYKALIDSGLAQDFSVGTGFDASTFYCTFGVGVEGLAAGDAAVPAIQDAVQRAYADVLARGFEPERVDALLHQLELSLKHIEGNFGLSLMHSVSSVWAHRGDLIANLQLNPILARLKDEMARDPRFLESYVRDVIMSDATKEVHVLMTPSDAYVAQQEVREHEALATRLSDASNADLDRIARVADELAAHQQQPQPVDCLPTLTLADIPATEPRNFDFVETRAVGGSSGSARAVEFVAVPTTNEISYVRLLFDVSESLPLEYQLYVPLFTTVFGALGTSQLAHDVLPTVIQNCSGGISCAAVARPALADARGASSQALLIGTMCLPHKVADTLQVLYALLTDTQFLAPANLAQLRIQLQMSAASASNAIASSGASLAGVRSRVGLTHAGVYHELYSGLTHVAQLQQWAQSSDDELRALAGVLQEIAQLAFVPENLRLSVVTEDKLRTHVATALETHIVAPLEATTHRATPRSSGLGATAFIAPTAPAPQSYFGFPISVNFNVRTLPSVSFAHADHVPLTVLAQMMSSCFLHQQVREQGGAYGAGVAQGEGYFTLSSHYDPNTWETLAAFDGALAWAADGRFSDRDVQEALLSLFAGIDAPKAPSHAGRVTFLRGITNEMRQARREQFLGLSRAGLVDVAQRYFACPEAGTTVIVGKEGNVKEFDARGFVAKQFSS